MEINWKKVGAIGAGILLVGSLTWAGIAQSNANTNMEQLSQATIALKILQADYLNIEQTVEELNNNLAGVGIELVNLREQTEAQAIADAQIIADYEAELLALEEEIVAEVEAEIVSNFIYTIDGFGLAETISEIVDENDYEILLDSEVRFDGDDYDFEEVLSFTATSDINGNDYSENTYLVIDENDMEYKVIFDDDLDTSLIDEDETLKISFLGKELEIIEWDNDKIIIENGEEFLMDVDTSIIYNEKVVELVIAGEDFAYVGVDGEFDKINEDETEEINGLNIKVDFSAEGTMANLKISDADDETILEDGDEFAEDSMWEYVITPNNIGLVLVEDLTDIDEDSDYNALAAGESVSLPNDYLSLTYNGICEVDMLDVRFSEKDGFVKIKGDFSYGLDNYELIYVDETGFYDSDYEFISNENIEVEDTDSFIELVDNTLVVEDVVLNLDFSDAIVNGNSVLNKDDNYRSSFGIVIESPENNLEDEEFRIFVPEEIAEVSLMVN